MVRSKKAITVSAKRSVKDKSKVTPKQASTKKAGTSSRASVKPKAFSNPKMAMEKAAKAVTVAAKKSARDKPKLAPKRVSTKKFSPAPLPNAKPKLTSFEEIPMEKGAADSFLRLLPPPFSMALLSAEEEDEIYGWKSTDDIKVRIPQQPRRLFGEYVIDAPRINDGMISLGKIAASLGWFEREKISFTMFPDKFSVIGRPADAIMSDGTNRTVAIQDHLQLRTDAKQRLRLPPGILMALGLKENDDQVLIWGSRFQNELNSPRMRAKRGGGGGVWHFLMVNPYEHNSLDWEGWLEW